MPKQFAPTYKHLQQHDHDWRVFCVGHLGYDSYDEEESDEDVHNIHNSNSNVQDHDQVIYNDSDDDEEMFDTITSNRESANTPQRPATNIQPSTSTSFLQRLLGASFSSSLTGSSTSHSSQAATAAVASQQHSASRYITTSNKKRRDYHKWMEFKFLRNVPIRQVSAGGYHVVMLLDSGDVYTWGWGKCSICKRRQLGQLGHGDTANRLRPTKIKLPPVETVVAVPSSGSSACSCSVKASKSANTPVHSVQCVCSPNAQPSSTSSMQTKCIVQRHEPKIIRVKGGGRHTLLLSDDGRVFTFGCAEDGRLGHGDRADCITPKEITGLRGYRVTFIDSGFWHSIAATFCKRVFVFGHGEEGKLGLGDTQSQLIPKEIVQLRGKGVLSASGGAWHTVILTEEQRVYTAGSNYWGQLGVGTLLKEDDNLYEISREMGQRIVISPSRDACYTPIEVKELRDKAIIKVIAGSNFNVCLSKDGKVYTFGCGSSGKTGHGGNLTVFTPRLIDSVSNVKFRDICTGSNHTLLLTHDGRVFSFGWCRYGQLGHGNFEEQDQPKEIEALRGIQIEQITAGAFFTVVSTRKPTASDKPPSFITHSRFHNKFIDCRIVIKAGY